MGTVLPDWAMGPTANQQHTVLSATGLTSVTQFIIHLRGVFDVIERMAGVQSLSFADDIDLLASGHSMPENRSANGARN